ncbi:TetR/AcrR family transcriptional regulator [Phytoactinopolyspora limicola]|uniref:TetR/AcrR family transcriptional regulator n=1 Tax=Phytoactinopolyspora limicola TaxID=2715536 RepID=UPI001A9C6581|nr:TetR family transcriptional regulator [Phytoactinopolyspora limicola]
MTGRSAGGVAGVGGQSGGGQSGGGPSVAGRDGGRDHLLRAVIDDFAANGVGERSLRQIATAVGTSHRMLIYHFGSREGLMVAVVRAVEQQQRELLAGLVADAGIGGEGRGSPGGEGRGGDSGQAVGEARGGDSGQAASGQIGPADIARRFWATLADPALRPYERLFFEMCGRALQGDQAAAPLLDEFVEPWTRSLSAALVDAGVAPARAQARARLGVGVARGLLLDLLATGDQAGVDAAMEEFITLATTPT